MEFRMGLTYYLLHGILLSGELQIQLEMNSDSCFRWTELEVHNNTQSLGESISGVVHDQCSCNFTSANLEDPQLTCSDDGNVVIFTTTVVYSSDSGEITASDMIDVVKSWAAINGASLEIGGDTATVRQVCSPSCESSSPSPESTSHELGAVAAGTFIGGLIVGMILLAVPVIVVW